MRKPDQPDSTPTSAPGSAQSLSGAEWSEISERLSEGAFVADLRDVLRTTNSSLRRALGYGRDELAGKRLSELIRPEEAGPVAISGENQRLVAGENLQCRMARKDGSYSPATISTVRTTSGETIGIVRRLSGHDAADVTAFRLPSTVSNSSDAIIGKDLNGVVTDWNAAAERIFGYTADEMIGQSITKLIPSDRLHEEDDILRRIENGHDVDHFETVRQTKEKKLIDVSVTISPIRNGLGKIVGASKIVPDITKEKAREHEIERMSRLYDALSQINQAIVHTSGRADLFARVCRALVERGRFEVAWVAFEESGSRVPGPVAVYGNGLDCEKIAETLAYSGARGRSPSEISFQTGRPYICQDLLKDAARTPWRDPIKVAGYRASAAFPIRELGMIKGTLNVCAGQPDFFNDAEIALLNEAAGDVSFALDNFRREIERRNAERAAREATEFADTVIERMPGIFCIVNDGRFVRWNRNLESMSEFSAGDIRRLRPEELFVPDTDGSGEHGVPAALLSGESPAELGLKTGSGGRRPCIFTTTSVEYRGARCLVCMGFDISRLKQAELALRKLNESLEQQVAARTRELRDTLDHAIAADGVKSVFLATMSNELRTPLNSIIGFTGILLQGLAGELNPEQTRQLGMIQNSARHLLDLINDVLDISKIEAGQLEIHAHPFDLRDVLLHVASLVGPMADRKGLELKVDVEAEVGAAVSDKRRIEQILINLLNNAIKFTERGMIRLSARAIGDYRSKPGSAPVKAVRLSVSDTGIGIRREDIGTLFQPFRQLDGGIARQHEGTGLGLAICRRLVDMLHGRISVESEHVAGSTFSVILPVNASGMP